LVMEWRVAASAGGVEPFGAGVRRAAVAGERVGGEESAPDAPFQEYPGELAQIVGCPWTSVILDRGDGVDEIAAGEMGSLPAHEPVKPAPQARQRRLDVDDLATLELTRIGAAFGQQHA